MIAPHELKNKTFSRTVRGYNPAEVDQYFDFLIEKYTEAYKAATEFEQKFNEVKAKYAELADEEESIRPAILKAQKLGEAIVNNAKKEASEKETEMISRCDKIITEAKAKVEAEKANIAALRSYAVDFQHKLFAEYVKHIETIRTLNLEELEESIRAGGDEQAFEDAKNEVLNGSDDTLITEQKVESSANETV